MLESTQLFTNERSEYKKYCNKYFLSLANIENRPSESDFEKDYNTLVNQIKSLVARELDQKQEQLYLLAQVDDVKNAFFNSFKPKMQPAIGAGYFVD